MKNKSDTSSYLHHKRRRSLIVNKCPYTPQKFFDTIITPITQCLNDLIDSYKPIIDLNSIQSQNEQQQSHELIQKDNWCTYSASSVKSEPPQFQYDNSNNDDDDSLYESSFGLIKESELELLIINQILTPLVFTSNSSTSTSTNNKRDNDSLDTDDLYLIQSSSYTEYDYDAELIQIGKELLNEINSILFKLNSFNFSLGDLFKYSSQSYAIITEEMKNLLIELTTYYDITFLSETFNISKKSILRWKRNGTMRKKGAGRKVIDPQMEVKVFKWYNDNKAKLKITANMIKDKAIQYTKIKTFQASKGWFEKYRRKYGIVLYTKRKAKSIWHKAK